MKKLLILFIALLSTSLTPKANAQNPADVDFTVLTDELLGGVFYPSLAIWNSTNEDPSDVFYSFYLNAPAEGSVIRVTVEETSLNQETVIQEVAQEAGEMVIDPIIKWKYDELAHLSQGGSATMTCILEIDGKEIDRVNQVVKYCSINECVFGMYDEDEEWVDIREMFSMYVNEDYPEIDNILQEILAVDRNRTFMDYQGGQQDFVNQLVWVWEYFSKRGTRYSNVVTSSLVNENVGSQYIRFIDQVINNVQANCVDGSVVLASVYRKIGLDVNLIAVPGHCFLGIGYPGYLCMDDCGATDPDNGGIVLLETTYMGANTDPITSFNQACEIIDYDELDKRIQEQEYMVINIEAARSAGYMPIKR